MFVDYADLFSCAEYQQYRAFGGRYDRDCDQPGTIWKDEQALVTFDGADMLRLGTGDRVTIKRSDHVTRLAKLSEESFMKTMRKKMKGN